VHPHLHLLRLLHLLMLLQRLAPLLLPFLVPAPLLPRRRWPLLPQRR
jgi:hypothetical protein